MSSHSPICEVPMFAPRHLGCSPSGVNQVPLSARPRPGALESCQGCTLFWGVPGHGPQTNSLRPASDPELIRCHRCRPDSVGQHTLLQGPPHSKSLTISSGLPLAMSQNNFKINYPLDLTYRAENLLQHYSGLPYSHSGSLQQQ